MTRASDYTFVTEWVIPASQDRVWKELSDPEAWPRWWRGVEEVTLLRAGDADGIGALRRYTWKSKLPYRLTFMMETTRIEPQTLIEGRATGELEGRGLWTIHAAGEAATEIRYDWEVATTRAWMRALAPMARPFFNWNHDVIMEWGRIGLVARVGGAASPRTLDR
jgi:uncharacterized protein YndB with AHSA1/START domain